MIDKIEISKKVCEQAFGLERYVKIMCLVHQVDISKDKEFQTLFNGYYGVRRHEEWRKKFYNFFQSCKTIPNDKLTFQYILENIYREVGQVESSFASKMLASFKSEMPLWDKRVLNFLGLKPRGGSAKDKISESVKLYDIICQRYSSNEFLGYIHVFDEMFPCYKDGISCVKKIDCLVWVQG